MADSLGLWAVNTAVSKHLQGLSGTKRSDWYLKCSLCVCRVKAGGGKLAERGRGVTKKKAVWLPQRWIVRSILAAEQQHLTTEGMWSAGKA